MLTSSSDSLYSALDEFVATRLSQWCRWRQQIHRSPELSWEERETTEFVRQRITGMGLDWVTGPRNLGGTADIITTAPARGCIGLRGDMDAIPVAEVNDVPYRSQRPGIMHACGHDVHTTVALAVCETLQHLKARECLPGPLHVRAVFQPAEEVAQGAREMMEAGNLKGVDAILAMHVDPSRATGTIGIRNGKQTASCDELLFRIKGTGGHGARPHETADTILAAVNLVQTAHGLIPRIVDARDDTTLSFCRISGGHSANVIPVNVEVQGTLRTFSEASRKVILERLERLATSIADLFAVEVDFRITTSIPSVNNSPPLNRLVAGVAGQLLGPESVGEAARSMGGEDFACYQQTIPGALIRIGSAGGQETGYHLHSPRFDVDPAVIATACRLLTASLIGWFAQPEAWSGNPA